MFTKSKTAFLLLLGSIGSLPIYSTATGRAHAAVFALGRAEPPAQAGVLSAATFAEYQKQIKPQSGESRWMEVPWFLDLHEARRQAAAEGKPLFIYSSGGATGIGAC